MEVKVRKSNEHLVIEWLLTKVKIPNAEIIEVIQDDTYAGEEKNAMRIGPPYGTTDRIVVKTKSDTYILFTSNPVSIEKKILIYE